MRVIRAPNRKIHLCDGCPKDYPTCNPAILEFGNWIGNDNITSCSEYTGKIGNYIISEVAPDKKQ